MSMTIALCMIVKNEGERLPRLAGSLAGQVDYWSLIDTGSTDDTMAVAQSLWGDRPGQITSAAWTGYGPTRNLALDAAEGQADWMLHIDADEIVHGDLRAAVESLQGDAAAVKAEQHYEGLRFWLPRLVRCGYGWRWNGRCHEYLSSERAGPTVATDAFYVEHLADGGNRPGKLHRELGLLMQDWDDQVNPSRTSFYIARTYDDMGRHAEAAEWYARRIELGGWDQETSYSRWRHGACLLAVGRRDEAVGVLWSAWGADPGRAEPLWSLAEHYRVTSQWRLAWLALQQAPADAPADTLFVHSDVYAWRLDYERSITAYYVAAEREGLAATERLLAMAGLPESIRAAVQSNQRFYRQ
jgi:glycosyltransferase involved in cell wall biosynthesis